MKKAVAVMAAEREVRTVEKFEEKTETEEGGKKEEIQKIGKNEKKKNSKKREDEGGESRMKHAYLKERQWRREKQEQ